MKNRILAGFAILVLLAQNLTPHRAEAELVTEVPEAPVEQEYTEMTFIISAYYSPLPGQNRYATGSYEGDIRLNGNGTNGADGTPVFPGMIAAPKTYPFGTKMYIPGIGTTSVHDRGGAIVSADGADSRGYAYDRLDVWMGHGDEGLMAALQWGKRTVSGVKVYGVNPQLLEQVYINEFNAVESFVQKVVLTPLHFKNDIYYGTEGSEVQEMQDYLVKWGYLSEANGFYGDSTAEALYQFQLDFNIVRGAEELGAGHFGINTRKQFEKLLSNEEEAASLIETQRGLALMEKYDDLKEERRVYSRSLGLGDSGAEVTLIQEELNRLGFLRIPSSEYGYYGEVTEHAVFKFQQSRGIVGDKSQMGAGYVGPVTRSALNIFAEARFDMKRSLAFERNETEEGRHFVLVPQDELALRDED